MLKQEDVGNYYTNEYGDIFQMIAYCPYPTVVMMDLKTGRKEHVVTDCLNAESYIKLVKEVKESEKDDTSN